MKTMIAALLLAAPLAARADESALSRAYGAAESSLSLPYHYSAEFTIGKDGRGSYAASIAAQVPLLLKGRAVDTSMTLNDSDTDQTWLGCRSELELTVADVAVTLMDRSITKPLKVRIYSEVGLPLGSQCPDIDLSKDVAARRIYVELEAFQFPGPQGLELQVLDTSPKLPALHVTREGGEYVVRGLRFDALVSGQEGLHWSYYGPSREEYDQHGNHTGTYTGYTEGTAKLIRN